MLRLQAFLLPLLICTCASWASDAYEPNDTTATAAAVPTDTDLALFCEGVDWYKFTVPQNGTLQVDILFHQTDDTNDLDLYLYGPDGSTLLAQSESGDDNERVHSGPLSAGTYFVKVLGYNGATNDYTLRAHINQVQITLPQMRAIELPTAGQTTILGSTAPMSGLLASATAAGGLSLTTDRDAYAFPLGPTLVTWTAWAGAPNASAVMGTESAYVWVYRHGQTPLGVASNEQSGTNGKATGANQGYHIVRDSQGRIHAAWFEGDVDHSGTAFPVYYRMGTQDPATGEVIWGAKVRISDASTECDRSLVAMAVSDNYVHFAWAYESSSNQVKYRRMKLSDGTLGPIRTPIATGGTQRGNCPGLAVRGDDEIHVLCGQNGPNLTKYARSIDGGATWPVLEDVPPADGTIGKKSPTLAVDRWGNAHVLFTYTVRNAAGAWSETTPNNGYWQLYYVRRNAAGGWTDAQSILDAFPEWTDAHDRFDPADPRYQWDTLADWADMEIDENDTIHVGWHGGANTHVFGEDEAHYATRPATGTGTWGAWTQPFALLSHEQSGEYSFCPSLCIDVKSNLVLPVIFHGQTADFSPLDSSVRIVHKGALEGNPIELSQNVVNGLNTWFPCACPRLYRHPNGRVWLDTIATSMPWGAQYENENYYVVYQNTEVTSLIYPDKAASPSPAEAATGVIVTPSLSWTNGQRTTGCDVYFGTSASAVAAATTASPEYKGHQAAAPFSPGTLTKNSTYYWRIDCVNARGTSRGDVWSFTTNANAAPVAVIDKTASGTRAPISVQFSAAHSTDDGTITAYAWNFAGLGSANTSSASFTFNSAGDFLVTLTVTDNAGIQGSATVTIHVEAANRPPSISSLSATPPTAAVGTSLQFAAAASDADGDALSYAWDFGDGSTLSLAQPGHAFAATGTYVVSVTVSDSFGGSVTQTISVTITSNGSGDGGGGGGGGTAPLPLAVTAFSSAVKFPAGSKDKLVLYGSLTLPDGFSPAGQTIEANVSGAVLSFTLNAKGKGRGASGTFNLLLPRVKKPKKGQPPTPPSAAPVVFQIKVRGVFATAWSDEGVGPSMSTGTSVPMQILLTLEGKTFAANVSPIWTWKGKTGFLKM